MNGETLYDTYRQGPATLTAEEEQQLRWAHTVLLTDKSSPAVRDEALDIAMSLQGTGSDAARLPTCMPLNEAYHPSRREPPRQLRLFLGKIARHFNRT